MLVGLIIAGTPNVPLAAIITQAIHVHRITQSAFFGFCAGNRHQIVAGARVKAVKVTPELLAARMEVANVAQLIGLSR